MNPSRFDVVVVGAGAAGLTAAVALARGGFAVALLEAAPFPGAENWSGCVYFCESLAEPDVLGPDGVAALAWERRLVERGFFATDGHGLLGMTYRDPAAFAHCYTVLRPVFDHHLAQAAVRHGAALLAGTTAESLIREGGRVVGVCTNRGPLYADLVFLAEGDASHLVTKEGYERFTDPRQAPKFLHGIKQVLELPPGEVERRFGVAPGEGAAYEVLLRNGTLRGKPVHLNMGGFVYTNREGLSVGLVLPADHLARHFGGDPNLLTEWFVNLPSLRPWLEGGRQAAFGAKLIRGGGVREIPTLVDHGLAVGGAASAVGVDFPYPNFTGPATAMGLLLARAAARVRAEGGRFDAEALTRHYLGPLRRHRYWQDVEFLRRWPGYVESTKYFFGQNIDLALRSAYIWTRSDRSSLRRWGQWLRLVRTAFRGGAWPGLLADARQLSQALRVREVTSRPTFWRLLLDGSVNAVRDLLGVPRSDLPPAGAARLHYSVAGGREPAGLPPFLARKWFRRFIPVLASAARLVYANDDTPLSRKLPQAARLFFRQVNLLDVIGAGLLGAASGVYGGLTVLRERLRRRGGPAAEPAAPVLPEYAALAGAALDMTRHQLDALPAWEARLAALEYESVGASHIHVLWPAEIPNKDAVTGAGLWHVCPAHVYEARVSAAGQLQVVVNYDNCIKCETCWRTSDLVDWGRDGGQRFVYAVRSPAAGLVLDALRAAGPRRPRLTGGPRAGGNGAPPRAPGDGPPEPAAAELRRLVRALARKTQEFEAALAEEPRTVDPARGEYLGALAQYAHQLATLMAEALGGAAGDAPLAALVREAARLAGRRVEHVRHGRFSWAAADGRQLRWHHLPAIEAGLGRGPTQDAAPEPAPWLRAEEGADLADDFGAEWGPRLDRHVPAGVWRRLEAGEPLAGPGDDFLRGLAAEVPPVDPDDPARTLHPPLRKWLLAELGRRDPSLAYRVAGHLWARDLLSLAAGEQARRVAAAWARGEEWACLVPAEPAAAGGWSAVLVPAAGAAGLLVLLPDRVAVTSPGAAGVAVEPVPTLGLRGAGLCRVTLAADFAAAAAFPVDPAAADRLRGVVCSADLVSIAAGMADLLCRRAVAQATGRVQFPGLFHDEESRDTIGKFGAVKKMVADAAACAAVIGTLDWDLSPAGAGAGEAHTARLLKSLAAELLGTAPGSVSYNAGQVFGGTAYSEDDILSKYYRDAAAWRFLDSDAAAVFGGHGRRLLGHWTPEAQPLTGLGDEARLFGDVARRQALLAELDELRHQRSRVKSAVQSWAGRGGPGPAAAEFAESLGRQDAYLLAGKALLLRVHARMDAGIPSEVERALLRVWLEASAAQLDRLEGVVARAARLADLPPSRPEGAAGPQALTLYGDYLGTPEEYSSGDFLCRPVRPLPPRFVPEMVATDPALAAADRALRADLAGRFGAPRDGLAYERYAEREHRPDPADLEFCRRRGYFRMFIPPELGGEGRPKAEYYLLTTNAHRIGDVSLSLTIQVNSSLGTTPVLLARGKDLPGAERDLARFAADADLHHAVAGDLQALLAGLAGGDAGRVAGQAERADGRLQGALRRPALRVLAHGLQQFWQQAGAAIGGFNFPAAAAAVRSALSCWQDVCDRAPEYLDEVRRRREACDLFLRWVAAGQISAFALTEPSAGSDTARVATRARLRSVPAEAADGGVWAFVPHGGGGPRHLLDARRLEFVETREDGGKVITPCYRWSDDAPPAEIKFDEYDYEADDPGGRRYFVAGGRKVYFTDVGQLRERNGRAWYDYWELTGAKMWITNGRMCGIMCLYAKTEEGITGFVVDRHAEGLVVGRDEDKMGQCGSPTNELSLQSVRVPRENVIGLEGRGQVNALETLNVGRAGIAMSAMSQMEKIIAGCRAQTANSGSENDLFAWRLRRMEEVRFVAEALAYGVVGRFEHQKTKSERMESAAAKMLVSELLHQLIETAEEVYGAEGQTRGHLVEKRKRDARVLNIYEGTNEVQRFLLLKDLAGDVGPRWLQSPQGHGEGLPPEGDELERLRAALRERCRAALALLGQQLWQNPNLQANCFLLSEAVAWFAAAESTYARLMWLRCQSAVDPGDAADVGRRAFVRCAVEVTARLGRFDEALAQLRRGFYAPSVRAASLLFRRAHAAPPRRAVRSRIERPFSVLVVLEPPVPGVHTPEIAGGEVREPYAVFRAEDRAALESALRLRDAAAAGCTLDVASVGTAAAAALLREPLSLGADSARLLVLPDGVRAAATDQAAAALAAALPRGGYDLVLGGGGDPNQGEGWLAPAVAAALGLPFLGAAEQVGVRADGGEATALLASGGQARARPLPGCVAVDGDLPLRDFTTAGYVAGLGQAVVLIPWPDGWAAPPVAFTPRQLQPASGGAGPPAEDVLPAEASQVVLQSLGRNGHARRQAAPRPRGPAADLRPRDVDRPSLAAGAGRQVLAVVAAGAGGRLGRGAAAAVQAGEYAAQFLAADLTVLLFAPEDLPPGGHAVEDLAGLTPGDIVVAPAGGDPAVYPHLFAECWPALRPGVRAVVGEAWAEPAFLALAGGNLRQDRLALRVSELDRRAGRLSVETGRFGGRARGREELERAGDGVWWLSVREDAETGAMTRRERAGPRRVERWRPAADRFYLRADIRRLLDELKQQSGLVRLTDAEFVIDVGFGVGSRDGYDAAVRPLEEALRGLGVRGLVVGGSRKVTEELHLLPPDRQIGQSGVSVRPRLLLAVGVSGAPQHINYIDPQSLIIAFNRDPDAPLMTLNRRQPLPRVYPVVGDLFETVPAFIEGLRSEPPAGPLAPNRDVTDPV